MTPPTDQAREMAEAKAKWLIPCLYEKFREGVCTSEPCFYCIVRPSVAQALAELQERIEQLDQECKDRMALEMSRDKELEALDALTAKVAELEGQKELAVATASSHYAMLVKADARIAELQGEVARLDHIHKLDHSLADQRAAKVAELEGERDDACGKLSFLCGVVDGVPLSATGGCGGNGNEAFRCVECNTPFHRACLKNHCADEIANLRTALARQGEVLGRVKAALANVPHLENDVAKGYVFRVEPCRLRDRHHEEACARLGGQCAIRDALGEGKESNKNGT